MEEQLGRSGCTNLSGWGACTWLTAGESAGCSPDFYPNVSNVVYTMRHGSRRGEGLHQE